MTMKYNLHTHTQYCDGHATMEQMAQRACDDGFDTLGFTPHASVPDSVPSPVNMKAGDAALYAAECQRLKEKYRGRMKVLAGAEYDFLGKEVPFPEMPGLDYSIGSVHFIQSPLTGGMVDVDGRPHMFMPKLKKYFDNDIHWVCNEFFNATIAMIERGGFDILGHLDKIASNASAFRPGIDTTPGFRRRVNEVIDAAADCRIPAVEINTKFTDENGRLFPAPEYWKKLKGTGMKIYVNSDAHYPDKLNAGREYALKLLELI